MRSLALCHEHSLHANQMTDLVDSWEGLRPSFNFNRCQLHIRNVAFGWGLHAQSLLHRILTSRTYISIELHGYFLKRLEFNGAIYCNCALKGPYSTDLFRSERGAAQIASWKVSR